MKSYTVRSIAKRMYVEIFTPSVNGKRVSIEQVAASLKKIGGYDLSTLKKSWDVTTHESFDLDVTTNTIKPTFSEVLKDADFMAEMKALFANA